MGSPMNLKLGHLQAKLPRLTMHRTGDQHWLNLLVEDKLCASVEVDPVKVLNTAETDYQKEVIDELLDCYKQPKKKSADKAPEPVQTKKVAQPEVTKKKTGTKKASKKK